MPGPQAGPFKVDGKEDSPPLYKHTGLGRAQRWSAGAAEHGSNPELLFLGLNLAA